MPDMAARIRTAVEQYRDPYLQQTLLEAGALDGLEVSERRVGGTIRLGVPVGGYVDQFRSGLAAHLAAAGLSGCEVRCELAAGIVAHSVQRPLKPLPGVSNIVAVASGKGGVGKSTVAANLALAWAAAGARVGMLDADIYGPSQPLMLGLVGQRPTAPDGKHLVPLEAHGLKAMSIGFLVDASQAVVWRGPMVTQALTQLLGDTAWGELDYLVVDMPPGTGDIQLTLAQRVPVSGAVIVTTPQDLALADARKGLAMFEKVAVPVLGIVENMSLHVCSHCGHVEHIFGAGGGERLAAESGVQLLGSLPLDAQIRVEADSGAPTVVSAAGTARAAAYVELARHTAGALARRGRDQRGAFPRIVVEQD
ncbi:MAG: iron-sulfur cluster carrier protein ApbC [Proteobacteria bacterium]|nr:iron-sulfur cluster carrier protein ApbC [Pseudomonadota bacterium]